MNDQNGRVWFITGASTGFGRSLAHLVLARGDRLVATARSVERLDAELKEGDRVLGLAFDVGDEAACKKAVDEALARFGRIDVLVNNAGHGMIGAVEEVSDEEARRVYGTNVFGVLNMLRAALPSMRKQRSGFVVNIGSVGGLLARAGSGIYASTKFALEGITEALHYELAPLGIKAMVVEPGPFRTDFLGRSMRAAACELDEYMSTAGAWRETCARNDGTQPGDPDKAAALIVRAVDDADPPLHLVLGSQAMDRAREKLQALLDDIDRWHDASAATAYQ